MVGRYFCEHPHYRLGQVYYERPLAEAEVLAAPEEAYAPTPAFVAKHEVLSFSLLVTPQLAPPLTFGAELVRSAGCVSGFTERLAEGVLGQELNCDRGGLDMYFAQREGQQAVQGRVAVHAEQSLQRDSRVRLADEQDAFGLRRIALDWQVGEIDIRTMRTAALELGAHFAEQGIGRVRLDDWLLEAEGAALPGLGHGHRVGGHHHMCATRMSADPRAGVVDGDCRVHGLENLYVGGSSVFASTGYANPTYTIVQLALRLGDHLDGLLRA
jgi:choline dehydrogenase-like flavoprotein